MRSGFVVDRVCSAECERNLVVDHERLRVWVWQRVVGRLTADPTRRFVALDDVAVPIAQGGAAPAPSRSHEPLTRPTRSSHEGIIVVSSGDRFILSHQGPGRGSAQPTPYCPKYPRSCRTPIPSPSHPVGLPSGIVVGPAGPYHARGWPGAYPSEPPGPDRA